MRTAPIQNNKSGQALQTAVPQEQSSSSLYDEFSHTLDKIASKVFRSQRVGDVPQASVAQAKAHVTPHQQARTIDLTRSKPVSDKKQTPVAPKQSVATPSQSSQDTKEVRPTDETEKTEQTEPTVPDGSEEAQNGPSEAEKLAQDATTDEKSTEQEQQIPSKESQELASRVDPKTGEAVVLKEGETEVADEKEVTDKEMSDVSVNEEKSEVLTSEQSTEPAPQSASPLDGKEEVVVDEKDAQMQTAPASNPAETQNVSTEATVEQEKPVAGAEDITAPANTLQEFFSPKVQEQNADSSQDLLAKTLEKIIQNKLLEATGTQTAALQRDAAFQIAREAQKAQLVISQLNQGLTPGLAKTGALGQTQAQGLQFSDVGAFRQAESSRGDEPKGAATLTKPQAVRTMERVENALKEVSKSKDGKMISVRLDPPELGTVKVDVSYKDGGIHARIAAEQGSVVHLLKDRTHELVSMIRKLGLNVEKVTVTVSSQDQNAGTLGSFESFKDGSSSTSNHGSKGGRRFGVEQGMAETATLKPATDDHWIA